MLWKVKYYKEFFFLYNIIKSPFRIKFKLNNSTHSYIFETIHEIFCSKHNIQNNMNFFLVKMKVKFISNLLNTIIKTSIKIGLIPCTGHFFKLSNINIISKFKQNLIEDFYQQNKCFNSSTCYVCKRIEESKDDFTKKRIKKIKRIKNIIKHKGCQKSARIKKMLK